MIYIILNLCKLIPHIIPITEKQGLSKYNFAPHQRLRGSPSKVAAGDGFEPNRGHRTNRSLSKTLMEDTLPF